MHVNISDSARGAVFPPTLRSTPQDWTHPKVQLCAACFPRSYPLPSEAHNCTSLAARRQVAHGTLAAAAAASGHHALLIAATHPNAELVTLLQVIWIDVGTLAWLSTDSDEFYVDMALESRDSRYDGNRPRIRVRACFHLANPSGRRKT